MSELYQSCPLEVGLQVSCRVCAERKAESDFRVDPPTIGNRISRLGRAEGMPDSRRASHARPCGHVYCYTPEASGRLGDRFSEREERHCRRTHVWEREELF